ncbi:threonyl-carbamoyl synthesis 4 [Oratosquilla oratoria]|uniref:threonyl-carbamoyl synthesis 4 n=1 Tax=Oratosquilla oratoria TaxID=337810 RepID=UPI003F764867
MMSVTYCIWKEYARSCRGVTRALFNGMTIEKQCYGKFQLPKRTISGLRVSNKSSLLLPLSRISRKFCKRTNPGRQLVLGIETSCDDTGAAIVDQDGNIISECLNSQLQVHLEHGGIVPPVARNLHVEHIDNIVQETLKKAQVTAEELDAIATTVQPGLPLSLWVGTNYGKNLALSSGRPFIPIHHMQAHALTVRMVEQVDFPFLVLLVSGGHCLLVLAKSLTDWNIIGKSVDDAPGEALDKTARRLRLRHLPECSTLAGGRAIEFLAQQGNPRAFDFPLPMTRYRDCTFSFAGLKNAALKVIQKEEETHGIKGDEVLPSVADVCASFQYIVTKHLLRQTQKAMIYIDVRHLLPSDHRCLVISGGVASNSYIREAMLKLCNELGYNLIVPPPKLCTDNGVMIAWNGMEKWKANTGILYDEEDIKNVEAVGKSPIGIDLTDDVRSLGIKAKKWVKI